MPIDYLANFPIPVALLPDRLRSLLLPVGKSPSEKVEVTSRYDFDQYGPKREYVHMTMAVVPDDGPDITPVLSEAEDGVVSYSVPVIDAKGCRKEFDPSISGYDFVVASWGDSSFYAYSLAEKVWMAIGLTPRCVGNDSQRLIYDDLSLPEFGVAEGEVSNEFYWSSTRDISWKISNEYLRKYLWMRSAYGARVFFYECLLPDHPGLRQLMSHESHVLIEPKGGWYRLDIREHKAGLLIQVWATVKAVSPELCPDQTADGIAWPGVSGAMTHARADALIDYTSVYLDDKFLMRYEQSAFYDTTPARAYGKWFCSPSYRGQWSFTDCVRTGRNLVRVSMRELYKPKPDREILHAHTFVVDPANVAGVNLDEEHIVAKTQRLLDQLIDLGDNLSALGGQVAIAKAATELVGFSRGEVQVNGWAAYPQLSRLAQVAPLDMSQQAFLSRCKSLHEIWQRVPNGFLRSLLEKAGCPRERVKGLGSLKLLECLLNIVSVLNANQEQRGAFESAVEHSGWDARNEKMAPLFLNNDLRIADAHEAIADCLRTLQELGFDTAHVNDGYGRALDFVMDGVIKTFGALNDQIGSLLDRK